MFSVTVMIFAFDEFDDAYIGSKRAGERRHRKLQGMVRSRLQFRVYDKLKKATVRLDNRGYVYKNDRFLIRFENDNKCYVYIFNLDRNGKLSVLFPLKNFSLNNPLIKDVVISLPPDKENERVMYRFNKPKSKEVFYAFMSTEPLPYMEKLVKQVPAKGVQLAVEKYTRYRKMLERWYQNARVNIKADHKDADNLWFKSQYAKKYEFYVKKY